MTTKPKHPTIPMTAVKSALIESIGHHGDTLVAGQKGRNAGIASTASGMSIPAPCRNAG